MNTRMATVAVLFSMITHGASAQPSVSEGLALRYYGHAGGTSPVMDWISNPVFGDGLMVGTSTGGSSLVSRVREDGVRIPFAAVVGLELTDLRFDRRGTFGNRLLVATNGVDAQQDGRLISINEQFQVVDDVVVGSTAWVFDVPPLSSSWGDVDAAIFANTEQPTRTGFVSVSPTLVSSIGPGLNGTSTGFVSGVEFDVSGIGGGELVAATRQGAIATYTRTFGTGAIFIDQAESFVDLTQTNGGAFGPGLFVAGADSNLVYRVTEGSNATSLQVIGSGFDAIARLASDGLDRLFVAEVDGDIWEISAGAEPCVVDLTTSGTNPGDPGYGVPDGQVTAEDLTYYVELWLNGCP